MTSGIFLLRADRSLSELSLQPYDSERLLQALLAEYPNLMAGSLIDPEQPRRWFLVRREIGVPDQEDGVNRWALDHLFLDQDAIPTLVEVKRSSDSRIRREVIGQMLDYAANCVVYWPAELIRSSFEERCQAESLEPGAEIERVLQGGTTVEEFWERVRTNLQAGRVRLLFVADVIPPELRRVVEFLNQQMDPAEVLAVEIQQYVGDGVKGLVPRVWGATQRAQQRKRVASGERHQWDMPRFLAAIREIKGEESAARAQRIFDWAEANDARFSYGKSASGPLYICWDMENDPYWPVGIFTNGSVEVAFQWMRPRPAFRSEDTIREWQRRLNEIPGVSIPDDRLSGRPRFDISAVDSELGVQKLIDSLAWFRENMLRFG